MITVIWRAHYNGHSLKAHDRQQRQHTSTSVQVATNLKSNKRIASILANISQQSRAT